MSAPTEAGSPVKVHKNSAASTRQRNTRLISLSEAHWLAIAGIAQRYGIEPSLVLSALITRHIAEMEAEESFVIAKKPDPQRAYAKD